MQSTGEDVDESSGVWKWIDVWQVKYNSSDEWVYIHQNNQY